MEIWVAKVSIFLYFIFPTRCAGEDVLIPWQNRTLRLGAFRASPGLVATFYWAGPFWPLPHNKTLAYHGPPLVGGWAAAIHRCPHPYSRNLSICCLTWQRGFAGVIKWRIVSGRKHPGWFRWAQWGHGVLSRWMQKGQSQKEMEGWKQRSGERRLLVWKQRKEPQCKECWQSLEAEGDYEVKVKKMYSPQKGTQHLGFHPVWPLSYFWPPKNRLLLV